MSVPLKLTGRYEIRETLGQGGMGVVYRAWDNVVKRDVALKTLRDAPARAALQMFLKECEVLATLSHPNIVEIFDIGEIEEDGKGKPYFVMPLLPGATLDRLIRAASHRLTVERVVDILCQTCRGLQAAHERGLVHRDMKPSNIFVMDDDSVKIIDFGVAHLIEQAQSVGIKGTLLYMAPEQLQMKPATAASDIFALGVVAYEALTRRRPFEGAQESDIAEAILKLIPPPASDLNPAVSQALSRVIHRAMAKQPWSRYSSAREFADTLQKALRNEPIEFFDPARLKPRIERATTAFEGGDLQFAAEILTELESEGHLDPQMSTLRRQIELASRARTIGQLLESARTRFEHEEYPLALHKIQDILQLDAGNAQALGLKASIENKLTAQKIEEWHKLARQHLDNHAFALAREAVNNMLVLHARETRGAVLMAEIDRSEQAFIAARKEKQQHYQAALEAWNAGEIGDALSKLERVLELDLQSPDTSAPEQTDSYQQLYNKVRSEHESLKNSYTEAQKLLADRSFPQALAIAQQWLAKYPGHALFQALKFDIEEQQRQELSARIATVDHTVEAEPDLDRKVHMLEQALGEFPGEAHLERQLRLLREKRDLVNSIAAKARYHEERTQFADALAQWEILKTIYPLYPGLAYELDRVVRRRDQQTRDHSKARWLEQIEVAAASGEYTRAGELAASAEAEFPEDPEIAQWKDKAASAAGRAEEASNLVSQARASFAQERYDEALSTMRTALALDPRGAIVRGALIESLIERARMLLDKDWPAAEPLVREALELDPQNALAKSLRTTIADQRRDETVVTCFTRARQFRAAGDLEAALREAEECYGQFPLDPRLQQLRDILLAELDKARREKQRPDDLEAARRVQETVPADAAEADIEAALASAREIAAQYPGDTEFQSIIADMEQRLAEVRRTPAASAAAAGPDAAATVVAPAAEWMAIGMEQPPVPAPPAAAVPPAAPVFERGKTIEPGAPARRVNRNLIYSVAAGLAVIVFILVAVIAARVPRKPAVPMVSIEIRTVPAGATVRIDGKVRGTSNFTLQAPAGAYQIGATLEGFEPASASVKAAPAMAPIELALKPLPQTLRLITDLQEGKAALDDQPERDLQDGQATFDALPSGAHTLRVTARSGSAVLAIDIAPGRVPQVSAAPILKDLAALAVGNLGGTARVYTSLGSAKVDLDGNPAGEAGPQGLQVLNVSPGAHEIGAGDGKMQLKKAVEIGSLPALTVFLQSDQNIGTLLIVTGEDGVDIYINGQRYRKQTSRGQIRITREPKEYRVRVAKQGFKDTPEQVVQLARGEEKKVAFQLVPLPTTAHLRFSGATAGAQVLLDGIALGAVKPDGSFAAESVTPGEHAIELRAGNLRSHLLKKAFTAGDTVELSPSEVGMHATTGTIRVTATPTSAQIIVVSANGKAVPLSANAAEVDEGAYTVTVRAPGYVEQRQRVQIAGGQMVPVNIALVREQQKARVVAAGMEGWEGPWTQDANWFVRRGGGLVLYKGPSKPGTYALNIMLAAGGGLLRGKALEWVVGYADPKNYVTFRLERDGFRRITHVNGKRTEGPKKTHGLDLKDTFLAGVQIEVTPDVIVHRFRKGEGWVVVDTLSAPGSNFTSGKFGIQVQGNDEVRISGFGFYPKE